MIKLTAATPAYGTPSELESEFRDGIPSAVTQLMPKRLAHYFKRLYPEYYVQIITNSTRSVAPR